MSAQVNGAVNSAENGAVTSGCPRRRSRKESCGKSVSEWSLEVIIQIG